MKVLCECGIMCDIDPRQDGIWKPSKTMVGKIECIHKKRGSRKMICPCYPWCQEYSETEKDLGNHLFSKHKHDEVCMVLANKMFKEELEK